MRDRSLIKTPNWYQAHFANIVAEPSNINEALKSTHAKEWIEAMEDEMDSHAKNKTWTLVEHKSDMKVLGNRWVFKVKRKADKSIDKFKARLVAKGFKQQAGLEYDETFASVCRYESIRLLLALAAVQNLHIVQFDVKTAFLYGEIDKEIYMDQPEGFEVKGERKLVCKLNKSLYGLKQSPRCWNQKFNEVLSQMNMTPIMSDSCVYKGVIQEQLVVFALYVDDGLIMSASEGAMNELINLLKTEFEIKVSQAIVFVGLQIFTTNNGGIFLSQESYVDELLQKFGLENCNPVSVPIQPNTDLQVKPSADTITVPYRQLVGSLLFIARLTRPDVAFAVSKLAQFANNVSELHWSATKKVLRYLAGTKNYGLHYQPYGNEDLYGYCCVCCK